MRKTLLSVLAFGLLSFLPAQSWAQSSASPPPTSKPINGCYGEASTAGAFLSDGDRQSFGSLGAGCAVRAQGVMLVGVGTRANFGDELLGSVYARVGIDINAHLVAYGLLELNSKDFKVLDTRALALGGGLETNLFSDNLTGFVESTTSVSTLGPSVSKDDVSVRVGIRYWLK